MVVPAANVSGFPVLSSVLSSSLLSYPQREVKYRQVGLIPFRDLLSEAAAPSTRFSCERLQTFDAPKP